MPTSALSAPRLRRVIVDAVELYNEGGELHLDLEKDINCLVGANGVGKSTLLALINFALTGLVPRPGAAFPSIEEFSASTIAFSRVYFDGRVEESARDRATVTAEFLLGGSNFSVTRALFDGRLVASFSVSGSTGEVVAQSAADDAQSDIAESYEREVTSRSGFATFEQFSFWQLYVMTFDERRHLLFWDERTLSGALMLALGRDPDDATSAAALARQMERDDSLARNARWKATQATNKKQRLSRSITSSVQGFNFEEIQELQSRNSELSLAQAAATTALDESEQDLRDTSRTLAELALRESDLESAFAEQLTTMGKSSSPEHHPVVARLLREARCEVCGAEGDSVANQAIERLSQVLCPLCGSELSLAAVPSADELSNLDEQLTAIREDLANARLKYRRLQDEARLRSTELANLSEQVSEFLRLHGQQIVTSSSPVDEDELVRLDIEIAEALSETQKFRLHREELRGQLEPIMNALATAYDSVESVFVPAFRKLAGQFIGRDVDVQFERSGSSVSLRLEMEGQSRRQSLELSESQQFFLDIALRMTLISVFLRGQATLLIDTPEGSLDIAYETRAGALFHQFTSDGGALLTTSNLNSSRLMLELSKRSSSSEMQLFRMTDWVQLSDVQLESADLFATAFSDLDEALGQ